MTASINLKERDVVGSAKRIFALVHTNPKWGVIEGMLNSMTAMRKNTSKKEIYITLKVGNTGDTQWEDYGTGITNYEYLEGKMGYDTTTEEYHVNQKDPEYLNKMGIGINSIANLSKSGIVEFHSVTLDKEGRPNGLIATYVLDKTTGIGAWQVPAEHPDSRYVLVRKGTDIQTGVRVLVKNAKEYPPKIIIGFLSEILARKLKQDYKIYVRGTEYGEYVQVHAPDDFCSKHEEIIGQVHHSELGIFPVYADLHPTDRAEQAETEVLIKKVKMGSYDSEYLQRGYVGCDALDFKPDREGIIIDEYNEMYRKFKEIVDGYSIRQGFDKKSTPPMNSIKNEKKWIQKAQEMVLKYYRRNDNDALLQLESIKQQSELTGVPTMGKIKRIRHRCPDGQHWDATLMKCVPAQQVQHEETGEPKKKYNKHKHRGRKPKLSDKYDEESIPRLHLKRGKKGNDRLIVILDEKESTLWFNTSHDWVTKLENASDETMELLIMLAIIDAVPDNQDISGKTLLRKLSDTLDAN
jgi:hypothetical protein